VFINLSRCVCLILKDYEPRALIISWRILSGSSATGSICVYKKFLPMIFGQTSIQFTKALAKKFGTTKVGVVGPTFRKPTNGSYRLEMRMLSALNRLNEFARGAKCSRTLLPVMKTHWFANFAQLRGSRAPIRSRTGRCSISEATNIVHCRNPL